MLTYVYIRQTICRIRRHPLRGSAYALPRDVSRWWRQRATIELVNEHRHWTIAEGTGSESACVAFAQLKGDQLLFNAPCADATTFSSTASEESIINTQQEGELLYLRQE